MSDEQPTTTVSIPPLWSDARIIALANKAGNPWVAAAMRSAALQVRYEYEAERVRLLMRIAELTQQPQAPGQDGAFG